MIRAANLAFQLEFLPDLMDDIERLLKSGIYVSNTCVEKFERDFSKFHGLNYGIGVNSGTSALHAALVSLGIQNGDEVIVPSHTFIASVIAIILTGATPVLVDVNEYGLIDFDLVKKAFTKKTKAIMPVHLYGSVIREIDIQNMLDLEVKIIEDCSQAHGAKYPSGKMVGTYGEVSAFSLYPGKGLGGIGEGGICLTNDQHLMERLKKFRNWGTEFKYQHDEFGLNYRMDEIQGLVLSKKLKFLKIWNEERVQIAKRYQSELKTVSFLNSEEGSPVYHQFVIVHPKRDELQKYLFANGIETLIHYPKPNHQQKSLINKIRINGKLNMTEKIVSQILSLPIYPGLKKNDIDYIIETVNKFEI